MIPGSVTSRLLSLEVTPESPWLGLRSFTENLQGYFYGRRQETQELFERIQHRSLTVVIGESGLGKTSLIRAGLMPRLREAGYEPVYLRLSYDPGGADLREQILSQVRAAYEHIAEVNLEGAPGLWQMFHDTAIGFAGASMEEIRRPVIIIDQFEEIFTLGRANRYDDAQSLIDELAELVENRMPSSIRKEIESDANLRKRLIMDDRRARVVLSLRHDYLNQLERSRGKMPSMMENRFELRPLTGLQAYRAVREPGRKRCKRPNQIPIVDDETAREIVRFVAGADKDKPLEEIWNVPPLLSLICQQLNERRLARKEDVIEKTDLGLNAHQVLNRFFVTSFDELPMEARSFVEEKLISDSGYRESITFDSATTWLRDRGVDDPEAVFQTLVHRRLLSIEERGGVPRVELTHDILAPIALKSRDERRELEKEIQKNKEYEEQLEKERHQAELQEQELEKQKKINRDTQRKNAVLIVLTMLAVAACGWAVWNLNAANKATAKAKEATAEANTANNEKDEALEAARDAAASAAASAESEKAAAEKATQMSEVANDVTNILNESTRTGLSNDEVEELYRRVEDLKYEEARRADVFHTLAGNFLANGHLAKAVEASERAYHIHLERFENRANDENHSIMIQSLERYAISLRTAGDNAARDMYGKYLEQLEAAAYEDRRRIITCMLSIAELEAESGQRESAIGWHKDASKIILEYEDDDEFAIEFKRLAWRRLIEGVIVLEDHLLVIDLAAHWVAIADPASGEYIRARTILASAHRRAAEYDTAIDIIVESLDIANDHELAVDQCIAELRLLFREKAGSSSSEAFIESAVEWVRKYRDLKHVQFDHFQREELPVILGHLNEYQVIPLSEDDEISQLREAARLFRSLISDETEKIVSDENMAIIYDYVKEPGLAIEFYTKACDLWLRRLRLPDATRAEYQHAVQAHCNLANVVWKSTDDRARTIGILEEAVEIADRGLEEGDFIGLSARLELAHQLVFSEQYVEASEMLEEVEGLSESRLDDSENDYFKCILRCKIEAALVDALNGTGDPIFDLEDVLEMEEEKFGTASDSYISTALTLAAVHDIRGQQADAIYLMQDIVRKLVDDVDAENVNDHLSAMTIVSNWFYENGEYNHEIRILNEALELQKTWATETGEFGWLSTLESMVITYTELEKKSSGESLPEIMDSDEIPEGNEALRLVATASLEVLSADDTDEKAAALEKLAALYESLSAYDRQMSLLNKAVMLRRSLGSESEEDCLNSILQIAEYYRNLGERERAGVFVMDWCQHFLSRVQYEEDFNAAQTLSFWLFEYQFFEEQVEVLIGLADYRRELFGDSDGLHLDLLTTIGETFRIWNKPQREARVRVEIARNVLNSSIYSAEVPAALESVARIPLRMLDSRTINELGEFYSSVLEASPTAVVDLDEKVESNLKVAYARCLIQMGNFQESIVLLGEAARYELRNIQRYNEVGVDPDGEQNLSAQIDLIVDQMNRAETPYDGLPAFQLLIELAVTSFEEENARAAVRECRRSIGRLQHAFLTGSIDPESAAATRALIEGLEAEGKHELAFEVARDLSDAYERTVKRFHSDTVLEYANCARIAFFIGDESVSRDMAEIVKQLKSEIELLEHISSAAKLELDLQYGRLQLRTAEPDEALNSLALLMTELRNAYGVGGDKRLEAIELIADALLTSDLESQSTGWLKARIDELSDRLGEASSAELRLRKKLSGVFEQAGRYQDSLAELQYIANGLARTEGFSAVNSIRARIDLGNGFIRAGEFEAAIEIFREVFNNCDSQWGVQDVDTLNSAIGLTEAYLAFDMPVAAANLMIKYDEAASLKYEFNEEPLRRINVFRSQIFLADERIDDAIVELEVLLAFQASNPEVTEIARLSYLMGRALFANGEIDEAVFQLREALATIRELAPGSWNENLTTSRLGGLLVIQGSREEGERLMIAGLNGMFESIDEPDRGIWVREIPNAVQRLSDYYDSNGRADDAIELRQRLADFQAEHSELR